MEFHPTNTKETFMATEMESNIYKQSATYKHFVALYNLRALAEWSVNEKAYTIIKKAITELSKLESADFAEDSNGKLIRELLPISKPSYKD